MIYGDLVLCRALMRTLAFANSANDFLQVLVTSVLSPHEAVSAAFIRLRGDSLQILGQFGLNSEEVRILETERAHDPFRMAVVEAKTLTYSDYEEFVQDTPVWKELSSRIPSPSVFLPFETLEAIQGVMWIRFAAPIERIPFSIGELDLVQLAGELVVAKTLQAHAGGGFGQPLTALTPLECHVACLASSGLASKSIARTLMISESWTKKNLQSSYGKLGIDSRRGLGAFDWYFKSNCPHCLPSRESVA